MFEDDAPTDSESDQTRTPQTETPPTIDILKVTRDAQLTTLEAVIDKLVSATALPVGHLDFIREEGNSPFDSEQILRDLVGNLNSFLENMRGAQRRLSNGKELPTIQESVLRVPDFKYTDYTKEEGKIEDLGLR